MNGFRTSVMVAGLLGCSLASGQTPPPRESAAAYPASKVESVYSLGVKRLSKTQIQNSFATPLADRFVVLEIGFYPADGKIVSLKQTDFALRASDGKDTISPASPEQIASIYQKRPPSSRDVTLYPTANIGYESYPVYDPTNRTTRRAGGPVYGAGMGVGLGTATSPATTDSDRKTMETELLDKELKDGEVSKPVAGYPYFPISTKEKVEYQLEYHGQDAVVQLPLKDR